MNAVRAFFNIVLSPPNDWPLRLSAGESCNISHGHLGEVKEIRKKLGDDPFGNAEGVWVMEAEARPPLRMNRCDTRGLAELASIVRQKRSRRARWHPTSFSVNSPTS